MESWSALHRDPAYRSASTLAAHTEEPDPGFGLSKQDHEEQGSTAKLVDLAQQVQLNGIDVAQALKAPQSPVACVGGEGTLEAGKLHLEACQLVMDECYDSAIHPLVEALEANVYQGDPSCAEQGEFTAYTRFAADAGKLMAHASAEIDKALQKLQAQLEVLLLTEASAGKSLSSVDFEQATLPPRPLQHMQHLLAETRRELHATVERNVRRLWLQHKLVIRECELEVLFVSVCVQCIVSESESEYASASVSAVCLWVYVRMLGHLKEVLTSIHQAPALSQAQIFVRADVIISMRKPLSVCIDIMTLYRCIIVSMHRPLSEPLCVLMSLYLRTGL